MSIIDNNWMYKQSTTGINKDVKTIITGDTDSDYVKVVRCKDCKHYKTFYESYKQLPDYYPAEEDKHNGECNRPDGLGGRIHEDNFCSKGERKETIGEISPKYSTKIVSKVFSLIMR